VQKTPPRESHSVLLYNVTIQYCTPVAVTAVTVLLYYFKLNNKQSYNVTGRGIFSMIHSVMKILEWKQYINMWHGPYTLY
jgi:hypothetical protein